MMLAVPAQMFTRHSNARVFSVMRVQGFQVGEQNITDFLERNRNVLTSVGEEKVDFAKNPWPTLCTAPDHHAIDASRLKNLASLQR